MEKAKHSVRFEAEINSEGKVSFSKQVTELRLKPGAKVTVNIFGGTLSKRLMQLGVSEEEVEIIGAAQLEDREQVMKFLASQGSMQRNKNFRKRMMLALK